MPENILKWLPVYFFSMVKFLGGPISGVAVGLTVIETIIFTILGMMTSVFVFSIAGSWIRQRFVGHSKPKKARFTKKNRRIVTVWSKYGIGGVAFLTPLVFTPIVGTMIVVSFGEPLKRIWLFMFASAVFWAILCSYTLYYFGYMLGMNH